jgi:hypothetical protein
MGVPDQTDQIVQYFYQKTRELIKVKSYSLTDKSTKYVDIVRDVLRFLPIHWAATSLVHEFELLILTRRSLTATWIGRFDSQITQRRLG